MCSFEVLHQAAVGAMRVRGGHRCCKLHRDPREPESSPQPWGSGHMGEGGRENKQGCSTIHNI